MTPQEIVRALEARGMTHHQIAKAIGVTQSSIWRIAAGITTGPKYWVMDSLRLLLGGEGMSGDHNEHQKCAHEIDQKACEWCGHCCKTDLARVGEVGVWGEWAGLTGDEARKFYEKYTDRKELIYAIDKFLEAKNNA